MQEKEQVWHLYKCTYTNEWNEIFRISSIENIQFNMHMISTMQSINQKTFFGPIVTHQSINLQEFFE